DDDACAGSALRRLRGLEARERDFVLPFALGFFGARARFDRDPRLLHGGAAHRVATGFLVGDALSLALSFFVLRAKARFVRVAALLLVFFPRALRRDGMRLAELLLAIDPLVFELHQLLQRHVHAL